MCLNAVWCSLHSVRVTTKCCCQLKVSSHPTLHVIWVFSCCLSPRQKKNVMSTCKNHGSCLCSTPSVSIIFCLLVIARGTHHQPYSQMLQSAALSQPSHQHQQAAEWIMKLHQLWPLSWLVIFEDIHLSYFIQAAGPKLQVYLCPLQALLPFLLFILMCEVRYHNTC